MRKVDFHDFTPPLDSCAQRIELENGSVRLVGEKRVHQGSVGAAYLDYGDVTGDGQEEALVIVAVESAGSAILHCAYVYTVDAGSSPRLLWSIQTGDRADSGLRRLYAEAGMLMVELYSTEESRGACCPTKYGRIAFKWEGRTFQPAGPTELFGLPSDHGALPIMPEYKQK